uniref:Uncharacterized protein n=1 Tax=Varanus komodoensis TaxID=61221 RepID=A0A8D2Q1V6_VARKO
RMPGTQMLDRALSLVTIWDGMVRQALAEVLALLGLGSVAQAVLGKKNFGEYLSISLGFGFRVMLGIHAAGGVSGEGGTRAWLEPTQPREPPMLGSRVQGAAHLPGQVGSRLPLLQPACDAEREGAHASFATPSQSHFPFPLLRNV